MRWKPTLQNPAVNAFNVWGNTEVKLQTRTEGTIFPGPSLIDFITILLNCSFTKSAQGN